MRRIPALFLFLLLPFVTCAQLQVQPAYGLYLSTDRSSGTLQLRSTQATVYTVSVEDRDSLGRGNSCHDWLKVQEDELTFAAQSAARLHVSATIPGGSSEGEYCSDIVLRPDDGSEALRIPIHVRVGEVYSDVKLTNAGAQRDEEAVTFMFELSQMGNAAYRGNCVLTIENGSGKEIHRQAGHVDVYGSSQQTVRLPSARVPKGRYTVRMAFDSERKDLGDKAIPVMPKNYKIVLTMK
ncbi:hypothetical protein KQI65_01035 [bacterium]|nr:hypothetical protein [bacterium]